MKKEKKVWATWQGVLCICNSCISTVSPTIAPQNTTFFRPDQIAGNDAVAEVMNKLLQKHYLILKLQVAS